jgi:hypothetical protein
MGVAAQRIDQDKERDALAYLIVRMKVVYMLWWTGR